jgi:hypothetical protein
LSEPTKQHGRTAKENDEQRTFLGTWPVLAWADSLSETLLPSEGTPSPLQRAGAKQQQLYHEIYFLQAESSDFGDVSAMISPAKKGPQNGRHQVGHRSSQPSSFSAKLQQCRRSASNLAKPWASS